MQSSRGEAIPAIVKLRASSPAAGGATLVKMATPCLRLVQSIACQQPASSTAASGQFCSRRSISLRGLNHKCLPPTSSVRRRQSESVVVASGGDLGDFGARDPFPGELGSDFGNRPQGWADTEHQISIPSNIRNITGLHNYSCIPVDKGTPPLSELECKELLRKVVGWKLAIVDNCPRLRGEWKVKDFTSGLELFSRLAVVAEASNHHPDLHLEGFNKATADIWTHSSGGLTINDFILAAKIDQVDMRDLISKKNRAWA